MVEWLGQNGSDLNDALLPHGSDDDPATVPVAIAKDSTPDNPENQLAAAARAIAATPVRRGATIDAANQRRKRLENIQSRMHSVSRRMSNVTAATEEVSHQMERLGPYDYDQVYGRLLSNDDEEDGGGGGGDEKAEPGAMSKASILVLLVTTGIAVYLATLWDSLSPVVQCFTLVTLAWLFSALTMILFQYLCKRGPSREEFEADDAASVLTQFEEPLEPVGPSLV